MPKKIIDWSKCIIYKIWKDDDFYVGSTTDLASRKSKHKRVCNNEKGRDYNLKLYQTIRDKGGWNQFEIIPLEEYTECKSQVQARIREEEWRVKLYANLNMRKAFVVKQEYQSQYKQEHKEEIKIYTQEHKEEKKIYDMIYRKDNVDKIKEYQAQYRQDNVDKFKEKYTCKCGSICIKKNKAKHEKSLKHQNFILNSNSNGEKY